MKQVSKQIIEKLIEQKNVQSNSFIYEKQNIIWFGVFQTKLKKQTFGITSIGYWGILGNDKIIILDNKEKLRYAISLLEMKYENLIDELYKFENNLNMEINLIDTFPLMNIVQAGLEHPSDYWVGLALDWYDTLDKEDKNKLQGSLIDIKHAPWLSQKNRQKIMKKIN